MNAPKTTIMRFAPALFVVMWSTGFVGARYAVRDAGPFTFLAVRLGLAALVLAAISVATRAEWPSRAQLRSIGLAGIGMHALYLGGVFFATAHGLPAGLSALIAGLHPVVTSVLSGRVLHERLRRAQWIGVGVGIAGVVLVVIEHLLDGTNEVTGIALLAMGVSVAGMAGGTLVQRRRNQAMPLLTGTVVQYSAAAVPLFVAAVVSDHWDLHLTHQFVFAQVWLIGVLSIGAVLLLNTLIAANAAARVSSLFFLTPSLSALEGRVLFHEHFGPLAFCGLATAAVGVALVSGVIGAPRPGVQAAPA